MTKFKEWCVESGIPVPNHELRLITAEPASYGHAVNVVADIIPNYYAAPKRIADILKKFGKTAAAAFVEQKMPTTTAIKSGDLGEILCLAYVIESSPYKYGIKRLRWKDHRNMSMRGEDILAFSLDPKGQNLKVLKGEVKSRATMTTKVIEEARASLSSNQGLPSPHATSFLADRLYEAGEQALCDALDTALLKVGLDASQVTHMLFTFSGNDPSALLKKNLNGYAGTVPQVYVALHVSQHQVFIKDVFDAVDK